tara:strand:+ start:16 stop:528 length:513 start_codon:yes stop_codon:yes gene_type:complete
MAEVPIIISGLSAFVGAVLYKGGASLSIKYAEKIKRKIDKSRLNTELQNSIQNLKFLEFQNCNYKIKVYDNNYNKQQYVKMKNKYRYTDEEVSNEMSFLKRFDISYTRFDSYKPYLQAMVKEEVENSINRGNRLFEIQRSESNYKLEIEEDINLTKLIREDLKKEIIEDI